MRISVVAALAFPILVLAQQPPAQDWRFAHADATLVGSIRPQEILNSPILAAAISEAASKDQNMAPMLAMARGILGGITEIRFSLQDNGTPEFDAIALVSGRLDDAMIGMLAQDKASAKRIDPNTVLIGKSASLEQAALRMQQSAAKLQPRALSGTEALAVYDLWISGKLPDLPQTAGLKLNLRGMALGMSLRENIEVQLAMETTTAAMAESLIQSAYEAEAKQPVQYRGMLQSFVDGTTARFRMNVPRDTAIAAMKAASQVPPATVASNNNTTAPAQPQPLVPPPTVTHRQTSIVIQGLDGGPREIPLK